MAAAMDYAAPHFNVHRRPLPVGAQPVDYLQHSRSRTVSSTVLPPSQPYAHQQTPPPVPQSRRTLSNATTSTASTTNSSIGRTPTGHSSSYASSIRRSTSSRSNNTPSSYVALMRKQKATVWCDRAQHEDARILAQQRAAKMRAQMEVVGGVSATGGPARPAQSSGGIASKIRHHGAVKASAYSAAGNLSGGGVPMRLSASEVDEDNSDDDNSAIARYHQRNGSGRSSLGSGHRIQSYYGGPTPTAARFSSNGSTPPSNNSYSPVDRPHERQDSTATARTYQDETPVPGAAPSIRNDYFAHPGGNGGSGGSAEEQRFGDVGGLPGRTISHTYGGEQPRHTSDELRRRGSVDDRTTTMSGVRLFVANPDMDDD